MRASEAGRGLRRQGRFRGERLRVTRGARGGLTRTHASLAAEYLTAAKDAVTSGIGQYLSGVDFNDTGTLAAAGALAAVPALSAAVFFAFSDFGGSSNPRKSSPSKVYFNLGSEAVLLDTRDKQSISSYGKPDLSGTGCKYINLPYQPSSDDFLSKAASKCANAESVAVLGETPGFAASAAKELVRFGSVEVPVVYVSGDWKGAGLPWKEPRQGLRLPSIGNGESVTGALYATGAIGASVLFTAELDAILELVGIFGASSVLVKRFLFYEDRQRTLDELQRFFDERVAPQELIADLSSAYRAIFGDDTSIPAQPSKQLEAASSKRADGKEQEQQQQQQQQPVAAARGAADATQATAAQPSPSFSAPTAASSQPSPSSPHSAAPSASQVDTTSAEETNEGNGAAEESSEQKSEETSVN